jgi:hypothetical protein
VVMVGDRVSTGGPALNWPVGRNTPGVDAARATSSFLDWDSAVPTALETVATWPTVGHGNGARAVCQRRYIF